MTSFELTIMEDARKGFDLDRPEIDFMLSYHFFGLDSLVLRIFLS